MWLNGGEAPAPQAGVDSKLKGPSSFTKRLFTSENKNNPNGSRFTFTLSMCYSSLFFYLDAKTQ